MSARAPSRAVVVELVGLPGSGKSTVTQALRSALVDAHQDCRVTDASISADVARVPRARRRLALAGTELCRRPRRGAEVLAAIGTTSPPSARDAVAGAVQWLAVQRLVDRARRIPSVHLLEEGPLQTVWTLALRARRDADPLLDRLVRSPGGRAGAAVPDAVIVVEAPVDVLLDRLARRPSRHSRTQRLGVAEQAEELASGLVLLQEVLATTGRPRLVLVNDGAASPAELGRRAATWVLRAAEWEVGAPRIDPKHVPGPLP